MTVRTRDYLRVATDADVLAVFRDVLGEDPAGGTKDLEFERDHPRYRVGPRAGEFMDKPDLDAFRKLKPIRRALISKMPSSRSKNYAPVAHALDAIDRVIRLPEVKGEKIQIVHRGTRSKFSGGFNILNRSVELYDVRHREGVIGGETRVARFSESVGASDTVVHEIGHAIDGLVLGEPAGVQDKLDEIFAAQEHFPSAILAGLRAAIGNENPTGVQQAIGDWAAEIFDSAPVKRLEALKSGDDLVPVYSERFGTEIPMQVDKRYLTYLTTIEELWARSFGQYVATRSQDPVLLHYLTSHRAATDEAPIGYPHFWTQEEFAPIAATLDNLFGQLGWILPEGEKGIKRFDPLDHPRNDAGEFIDKPDKLDTYGLRLMFGEGTIPDVQDFLREQTVLSEREAREIGAAVIRDYENDRGWKAAKEKAKPVARRMLDARSLSDQREREYELAARQFDWVREHGFYEMDDEDYQHAHKEAMDEMDRTYDLVRKAHAAQIEAENAWRAEVEKVTVAHQRALLRSLRKIQPDFGTEKVKIGGAGERFYQGREGTLSSKVRADLEAVSGFLPADWVRRMNMGGNVIPIFWSKRAKHVQSVENRGDSLIYVREGDRSTALHELGHRVQWMVPGISLFERDFWKRRTEGGLVETYLVPPDPDFGSEYVRPDEFRSRYMGKFNRGPRFNDEPREELPAEILTMGIQDVWWREGRGDYDLFADDPEYAQLIVGLMASAKRDPGPLGKR
jgi:hypothetical protein